MIYPDASSAVLEGVRGFLGDQFSIYYAMLAVGVFLCSVYVAFSKYGHIVLGEKIVKLSILASNGV